MVINLTSWSLLFTISNFLLFIIVSTSATFLNFFIAHFHIHPLNVILLLNIGCFFLALISLKDVNSMTTLIISYVTISITLIFAAILSFILFIWHLLS